ncbi:hypothetical protein PE066_10995 [Ramlibacter tataouinensis]|uniref:hypothetical protein n=1 Tax=Ramlibacter tataouinensis TaxID=94132 RepID=UPI0022F3EEDD|nr:hypothetical protein [Ramlibacter tataouinensis]WBY00010.1 hypothetical protein PE066_10995 [Ramlibacter tataouinensis]
MKRRLMLLGVPLLAAAAAAQTPAIPESAYRRGMPEVLTPAPVPAAAQPEFNRAAFLSAYAKAGRPTIAVLWNREFTDMLQQGTASQVSIDSVRAGAASAEAVRLPGYAGAEVAGATVSSTTVTARETRTEQARRAGPVERTDLEMRSAFMQTMAGAGARLVDRNVVMRTTAAARKDALDSQQVETQALSRHAKLLMEVLNTRDPAAATGWSTYVSIKRLADGVVLAEGYMNGQEPEGTPRPAPRYEADPKGGFREVVKTRTVTDVGRLVAEQTLARLARAL